MSKEKNIPMRVVKEKTGLTSRQIRYYDEVNLIFPERSSGNQRLFSEGDIIKLKKIKSLLAKGYTISAIKKKLNQPEPVKGDSEENEFLIEDDHGYKGNKLNSLYPVSNRSYLNSVLKKGVNKKKDKG